MNPTKSIDLVKVAANENQVEAIVENLQATTSLEPDRLWPDPMLAAGASLLGVYTKIEIASED